jgi:hypothetical protein
VSLHDLYQQYHDQVQFLTIYIREAHPKDGWWFGGGIMGKMLKKGVPKTATDINDPKTIEERREVARKNAGRLPGSVSKPCNTACVPMWTRWMTQ